MRLFIAAIRAWLSGKLGAVADGLIGNAYIKNTPLGVGFASPLIVEGSMTDVQAFLMARGSGLAKVSWSKGWFSSVTAADWIVTMAAKYRIRPEYILTVLQAEQSLVSDRTVRDANFDIISLPDKSESPPPPPQVGYQVRRNGGYLDARNATNPNWTKRVADGNWWFAWRGDWKMVAAVGAGILGPNDWPSWDVRLFMGFANQIEQIGKITNRYFNEFYDALAASNTKARTVKLDDGREVVCGTPETYALLRWTPNAEVLLTRPLINKGYSA